MAAMMACAAAGGVTAVFEEGPHPTVAEPVPKCQDSGLITSLVVVTPTDAGTYPVVVFLHGWAMQSWSYRCLLKHVASHGFIAVAPQLHDLSLTDANDIETTKSVTNWLVHPAGLLYVLGDTFKLEGVEPDLSRLALAGHSRGGDTAFAVALGLVGKQIHDPIPLKLMFSALIGVDPVAGTLGGLLKVDPRVLTGSFDPRMPVLVIGTGLGPEGGPLSCAPASVGHAEFYSQCKAPCWHFVVRDYGHLDMLDDDVFPLINCMCKSGVNPEHTKELCRRTMGGLMVAFLLDKLEGKGDDLKAVLNKPDLAPAVLDHVEPAAA